jgi:hypothetical protein
MQTGQWHTSKSEGVPFHPFYLFQVATCSCYREEACLYLFLLFISFFTRFKEAESDCTEAIALDDHYVKAYSRRSTARKELGNYLRAVEGNNKGKNTFISSNVVGYFLKYPGAL